MSAFEFTEQMNEVSGFGGSYERACRAAVCVGADWLANHLHAHPEFGAVPNTFGRVQPLNIDAHGLLNALDEADFVRDDGVHVPLSDQMTGAMTHAAIHHLLFIRKRGWRRYVEKMSAPLTLIKEEELS